MNTTELVAKLKQIKLIPVIALDKAEDILPLGKALKNGGIPAAEITFRSSVAAEAIALLRAQEPQMLIGAGTVLTIDQVNAAKKAGADFIVTPGFNRKIVEHCLNIEMPITPGVNNPMAIEAALELGITTVKFFPAEASGGIKMLQALLAPYDMLQVMPTGGITAHNIRHYLDLKNVIACGGSWIVSKDLLVAQNWAAVEQLSREAMMALS